MWREWLDTLMNKTETCLSARGLYLVIRWIEDFAVYPMYSQVSVYCCCLCVYSCVSNVQLHVCVVVVVVVHVSVCCCSCKQSSVYSWCTAMCVHCVIVSLLIRALPCLELQS